MATDLDFTLSQLCEALAKDVLEMLKTSAIPLLGCAMSEP